MLGLYTITYDVMDRAFNQAMQIVRFVLVQDDSELYQNSVQQVFDGVQSSFTGGVLPHLAPSPHAHANFTAASASVRIAAQLAARTANLSRVELARGRPTNASSLWGVHTPSTSGNDGLFVTSYQQPMQLMDAYGRKLARDHIPNIFHSGPSSSPVFVPGYYHHMVP